MLLVLRRGTEGTTPVTGEDGAATLRSLAQRARRPEALSRPVVNGGGGFA
jgi:hypothetical protein